MTAASASRRRASPTIYVDRPTRPSQALHVHRSSAATTDREPAGDPADSDRYRPNINIPVVSIVWQYSEGITRGTIRTSRSQSLELPRPISKRVRVPPGDVIPEIRPKR